MIELPGLSLKNPIINASGTFSYEYEKFYDLSILGAICMKSCTKEVRNGNDGVRIAETPGGMLNCVGLQNPGVDKVIDDDLGKYKKFGIPVIASVAGKSIEDYIYTAKKLDKKVNALEINISCPNVKLGAMSIGTSSDETSKLVKELKKEVRTPIYVKLTPNVTSIVEIAKTCEDAGADGLSMINTLTGIRFDLKTGEPILGNITGGLSGSAILPVGLNAVYQCSKNVKIPIIGQGGISSATNVKEYLLAGASAVMVGTANFQNPLIMKEIIEELDVMKGK